MKPIPHRTLRLKALEQERKWLEADDPDAAPWWKGWQFLAMDGEWVPIDGKPYWHDDTQYRYIEPARTVTVYTATGAVELPEPMREAPEVGARFFLVQSSGVVTLSRWDGADIDRAWLANGAIFHTAEHAQAWADFQRMQRVGETTA